MRTVDRIEQLIEERGLNKARFCELMGVGTSYFSNWKRRGFPAKRLPEAARILDVSVEELTMRDFSPTEASARNARVKERSAHFAARMRRHLGSKKVSSFALSLDAFLDQGRITEKDVDLLWSIAKRIAATHGEDDEGNG